MDTTPRLRAALADLPAYKAGQRPTSTEDAARLASNETTDGPLPGVAEAVAAATLQSHRYPDPAAADLVAALTRHHQLPAGHVAVGTGSVAVGGQLVYAAAGPGDDVIFAWRSFEAYPIFVALAGARAVQVPLTDSGRHDLQAMAAAVTSATRAIIVCTPNNPTGPAVTQADLQRFCAAIPPDVLIIIDEAYREFTTATDAADGVSIYRDYPNVSILRTFSKAYGLAAFRVGYAVAHPPVVDALRRIAIPFGVSSPAQAAAIVSLNATRHLRRRVAAVVEERARVQACLRRHGWEVPDAQGNFVWLPTGAKTDSFELLCRQAGVLVRAYSGDGCRVTIGTRSENDRFLRVAERWPEQLPVGPGSGVADGVRL